MCFPLLIGIHIASIYASFLANFLMYYYIRE